MQTLLAYLFWHRPAPGVEPAEYEQNLLAYHEVLNTQKLPGYRGSVVNRLDGFPWMEGEDAAYEDCYLVDSSTQLDPLNELAVGPELAESHNRAARGTGSVAAGLYRLLGGPAAPEVAWATWVTKPQGMPYAELYRLLTRWTTGPDVNFWRRQMVLSPAPEFRILAPEPAAVPEELGPVQISMTEIYRPAGDQLALL